MKNGSAPGSDGITVEFMKVFWGKIGNMVTNSFKESYDKGELSYTQKQGIITLLHKGDDLDREQLNNWRPITLTNTDYKILAKVLAERLSRVIHKVVNEDQVGYIKGRNISTIIRSIDDVINFLHKTNKAGYLLAVDYSKAFDSVSKTFVLHAFKVFGFGSDFQRWISVLTKGSKSSINHGGWISEPFDVLCGIRQGCPFSPLAFILAVEILAIKIRNSTIQGTEIPAVDGKDAAHIKVKQMADDTTLFLKDKIDVEKSFEILNAFKTFSGLKLNKQKTKALQMGTQKIEEQIPVTVVDKIKILGIYFEREKMAKNIEENWKSKIDRIQALIKNWSKRDLSIQGKVVVIKTFLVSQLIYVMQSIGLPQLILSKINTILYKFLWQKKFSNRKAFEKVKRKIMEAKYQEGGLNMVNLLGIQKCIYLQWIGKLFNSSDQNWTLIPKWHLNRIGKEKKFFYVNCRPKEMEGLDKVQNIFWQDVLSSYLENKDKTLIEEVNNDTFRYQLLFNNSLLKYKNKVLFFQNWIKKGIEQIYDLIHSEEKRLLSMEEIQTLIGENHANIIFEYNALVNSIPKCWIQWIQKEDQKINKEQTVLCEASLYDTKLKEIRKMVQTKSEIPIPKVNEFWQRKLNFKIDSINWLVAVRTTTETRLRVLHWKILHNIYPTNIILNKMEIRENNKCTYCTDTVDYIEHFFYDCPMIKMFWKLVEQRILIETGVRVNLSVTDVLFGIHDLQCPKKKLDFINHIILIAKMCISIFRKTECVVPIQIILDRELRMRKQQMEKHLRERKRERGEGERLANEKEGDYF